MNTITRLLPLLATPFLLPLAMSRAAAAESLVVNGKATAADVRIVGGTAYVKLEDIARALGMTVTKRPDGKYELTRAGGANQIAGAVQGKVGEVLFDGKWRFQVLSVASPETYVMKTDAELYDSAGLTSFDRPTRTVKPAKGRTLVVLQCRAVNGVNEKRTLWTAISDPRIRTALADTEGSSHPPVGYDFEGGPIQSKWIVPGAALNFALLFSVPEGTKPKDLIFTLKNNQGDEKGNDVRVGLSPERTP